MASYEVTVEFDKNWDKILQKISNLKEIYKSIEFKEFIRDKVLDEMKKIIEQNTTGFGRGEEHSVFIQKVNEYKSGNQSELGEDYILIYNNTRLEQSEMTWVSPKTLENYPDGISISKLIEFGSGLMGENSPDGDWEVNLKNHGSSWSYKDPDDMIRHTSGIQGRFIYKKTMEIVKEKFNNWLDEYMKREMEK